MKGKGAQYNPSNPFLKHAVGIVHDEGIDEYIQDEKPPVSLFYESPREVLSKNNSQDLSFEYSINPYQGCEHGCIYCYARNSHTYWGFSAGLDFESKIIVKRDIASKLEYELMRMKRPTVVMISGNTDCYQPVEKQFKLTREILKIFLKYRNPVGIITKNALITRDLDLLKELAAHGLIHVYISITSLNERLRSELEPRTATAARKLKAMEMLSAAGVPVGVMNAPVIPGLTHHEIPAVLKAAADHGACAAGYTVVRLNGQLAELFEDWLERFYPDRAARVLSQIKELHGGNLNDSKWGRRMKGTGNYAQIIDQLFRVSRAKFFNGREMPEYNMSAFRKGGSLSLFGD